MVIKCVFLQPTFNGIT